MNRLSWKKIRLFLHLENREELTAKTTKSTVTFNRVSHEEIERAKQTDPIEAAELIYFGGRSVPSDLRTWLRQAALLTEEAIGKVRFAPEYLSSQDKTIASIFVALRQWDRTLETTKSAAHTAAKTLFEQQAEVRAGWLNKGAAELIRLGANEKLDVQSVRNALYRNIAGDHETAPDIDPTALNHARQRAIESLSRAFDFNDKDVDRIAEASVAFMQRSLKIANDGSAAPLTKTGRTARDVIEASAIAGDREKVLEAVRKLDAPTAAQIWPFLILSRRRAVTPDALIAARNEALGGALSVEARERIETDFANTARLIATALHERASTLRLTMPHDERLPNLAEVDDIAETTALVVQTEATVTCEREIAEKLTGEPMSREGTRASSLLSGAVFPAWVRHGWVDPQTRWRRFRAELAHRPLRSNFASGQWEQDVIRKNLALGAAIRCIDARGNTVLVPDAGIELVYGEEVVDETWKNRDGVVGEAGPTEPSPFVYIDWARTRSGFLASYRNKPEPHKLAHDPMPGNEDANAMKLKAFLNKLAGNEESVGNAFFTEDEARPVLHWLRAHGSIEIALDPDDGLMAIVLEPVKGKDEETTAADRTRADNVATIIAHFTRRALGDMVSAGAPYRPKNDEAEPAKPAHGAMISVATRIAHFTRRVLGRTVPAGAPDHLETDKTKQPGLASDAAAVVYAIAPDEVLPVAVAPLGPNDAAVSSVAILNHLKTSPTTEDGTAEDKAAIPERAPLQVRATRDGAVTPIAAAVALAERGIVRRNALTSAIESLKQFELNDDQASTRQLAAHAALFATIPLLMGLFFGAIFAETLLDILLVGSQSKLWRGSILLLLIVGGGIGVFLCLDHFRHLRSDHFGEEKTGKSTAAAFQNGIGGLLIGLSLAGAPWSVIFPTFKDTNSYSMTLLEAGLLGWCLAIISGCIFFRYMTFDQNLQETMTTSLFGSEHEAARTGPDSPTVKLRVRNRDLFKLTAVYVPLIMIALICVFKVFPFDSVPKPVEDRLGDVARYRDIFEALGWAMPILGFGVLVSAWNRFGKTGLTTLGHRNAQRRLKQTESLIREYEPLSALLKERNKSLHFADMEKAANAIAPAADLVKAHQERTEARFVRSTALVAAAVVALLQIDAFEKLEPKKEEAASHTADTWLRDNLIRALNDLPLPQQKMADLSDQAGAKGAPGRMSIYDVCEDIETGSVFEKKHIACLDKAVPLQDKLGIVLNDLVVVGALGDALVHAKTKGCPGCSDKAEKIHAGLRVLLEGKPTPNSDAIADAVEKKLTDDFETAAVSRNFLLKTLVALIMTIPEGAKPDEIADAVKKILADDFETAAVSRNFLLKILVSLIMTIPEGATPDEIADAVKKILADDFENHGLDRNELALALAGGESDDDAVEFALVKQLRNPGGIPKQCGGPDGKEHGGELVLARMIWGTNRFSYGNIVQSCMANPKGQALDATCRSNTQFSKRELRAQLREILKDRTKNASDKYTHLLVVGFADTKGLPQINRELSRNRAVEIRNALGRGQFYFGDGALPIAVDGLGEDPSASAPTGTNYSELASARRAEIRLCLR